MEEVDLFVIGAGSGGVRAARISSNYGARVMIAEEYRVGGTCVIRGCVPKKLLVYASRFTHEFEDAAGYGWTLGEPSFDWTALIANKDREINRLNQIYKKLLWDAKVAMMDAGIARPGMMVARTLRRKMKMITTTRNPASSSVSCASLIDRVTYIDWSNASISSTPGGRLRWIAGSSARIASATWIRFALDWRTTPMATAGAPM